MIRFLASTRMSALLAVILAAALVPVARPQTAWAQVERTREETGQEAPAEEEPEEPPEDDEELPVLEKMDLPSFERLMKGPAVDWIVLKSHKVITCEPLYPRPGTLDDMNQQIKAATRRPAQSDADRRRRLALYYLPVTLPEGEQRDYRLHIKFVREIIYYEDLMLRRVDALLDEQKVRLAYELLVAVENRQDGWPGLIAHQDRLKFVDAAVKLEAGQPEHALSLLEALHERNPTYEGLVAQLGVVTSRLVSDSLGADDPRRARYFVRRLGRRIANHRTVASESARMMQLARDRLAESVEAERAGRITAALDSVEQAARIWPELPEILPVYNRLCHRNQRLRVGVLDLPAAERAPDAALVSPAEVRCRQLTRTALFQPARWDEKDKVVRYDTRFFHEWEPTDLGHSIQFRLRPYRTPAESQPLLTAAALEAAIAARVDGSRRGYDARLAATVESLAVRGPFELLVGFRQAPLRPEALFAFPCRRASVIGDDLASADAGLNLAAAAASEERTYPFELHGIDARRAVYRRTVDEPPSATDRHLAEIIEIRYDSYEKAIQGLLRGEVSMLPRVPSWTVKSFAGRNEFFTQPYALPVTHVLQFHPRSRTLAARTVRRALVYALDRGRMLEQYFLHEAPGTLGRQTSAPFPMKSYAYDSSVAPHKFDPAMAFSLAKSAEKELGSKPAPLRVWCPNDPQVRAAAKRIVADWGKVGIEAMLIDPAPEAPPPSIDTDDWDVAYRTVTVAEPLLELWPLLALTDSTETAALAHLPTWLRHALLELDRAGDPASARLALFKLQRQLWAEVYLIPLWEIDDYMVLRKHVRGAPIRPMAAYQAIERWKVEPWYPKD